MFFHDYRNLIRGLPNCLYLLLEIGFLLQIGFPVRSTQLFSLSPLHPTRETRAFS